MNNLTEEHMIQVGVGFYGDAHTVLDHIFTQRLTSFPPGVPPDLRAWPVGVAVGMGLVMLIRCPNIVPYGPNTILVRACQNRFDASPARQINDGLTTWLYQKHLAMRYYHFIYDLVIPDVIHYHNILGTGYHNKVREHAITMKNQIACLLIVKCCVGWDMSLSRFRYNTLEDLANFPEYQARYYMFVVPMLYFLCTEMNPHNHLNARVILEKDLGRLEEYMRKRCKDHGIWCQEEIQRRIRNGQINHKHKHVCKGVEFKFARLCSLIIPDYVWPYNEDLRRAEKLYITYEQQNQMYTSLEGPGYDYHALARYGRPTFKNC